MVRLMRQREIPVVMEIEKQEEFPINPVELLKLLGKENAFPMVEERDGKIIGAMIYILNPQNFDLVYMTGAAKVDLHDRLKSKLSRHKRRTILYNVAETDLQPSLLLADPLAVQLNAAIRTSFPRNLLGAMR